MLLHTQERNGTGRMLKAFVIEHKFVFYTNLGKEYTQENGDGAHFVHKFKIMSTNKSLVNSTLWIIITITIIITVDHVWSGVMI